jgi:hypothetical protein
MPWLSIRLVMLTVSPTQIINENDFGAQKGQCPHYRFADAPGRDRCHQGQTSSAQRERDRLFGGHRRAFGPFQPKHNVSKLCA